MTFVLLDDKFHVNRKILRAGLAGAGLYARSLSFIADESTDGWIPHEWAKEVGTPNLVKKLLVVNLWVRVNAGDEIVVPANKRKRGGEVVVVVTSHGYYVPDYLHLNPSKREVEEMRRARSAAGRAGAYGKWHGKSHGKSYGKTDGKTMPPTPTPFINEPPQAFVPRDVTSEVDAGTVIDLTRVLRDVS